MRKEVRIFTPVLASVAAIGLLGAATLGGSAADSVADKTDRFALTADLLCEGQAWPNLTAECLAWKSGEPLEGDIRYITKKIDDPATFSTTLLRTAEIVGN